MYCKNAKFQTHPYRTKTLLIIFFAKLLNKNSFALFGQFHARNIKEVQHLCCIKAEPFLTKVVPTVAISLQRGKLGQQSI